MSNGSVVMFGIGLVAGGLALVGGPHRAIAEETGAMPGLYQIQAAVAFGQPGASAVWRLNTSTGTLDYCIFNGVTPTGAAHITCEASPPVKVLR